MTKTIARPRLAQAVRDAWDGAADTQAAAARLTAMVRADADLYRDLMAPMEQAAIMQALRAHRGVERRAIWNRPAQADDRVAALAQSNADSLFDMRLSTGKRLGDATRADVGAEAAYYGTRAADMTAKAGFFRRIADRLADDRTVAQAFSAADLESLRKECTDAA